MESGPPLALLDIRPLPPNNSLEPSRPAAENRV